MGDSTQIGDRMKLYERQEGRRVLPLLPVLARLDGKAFHSFCRGLDRPFDEGFSKLMRATTEHLVKESNAIIGYTQSDEISLLWHSQEIKSQIFMDGRLQKMVSILAAMATAYFNRHLPELLPQKAHTLPLFDCRVWTVPNREEAVNTLIWREQDATRNSISMAAQAEFSHKELHKISTKQMQEKLWQERQINWNDYPRRFKRGSYIRKRRVQRPFTVQELELLPPKLAARQNPELIVERWQIQEEEFPTLSRITNRVEVIFEGAEPVLRSDDA